MSNMVIQTNVLALNSHRNLGITGTAQARASARLSSGFRINSAADDAAGLAISEKMRGQIRGLDMASRNAQDGISLIQTAEGAMSTVNDMVIRIRELVVQAANDTNAHDGTNNMAQSDRQQVQREINQLLTEIDATTERTQFNTRHLINGDLAGLGGGGSVLTLDALMLDATNIEFAGATLDQLTGEMMPEFLAFLDGINSVGVARLEDIITRAGNPATMAQLAAAQDAGDISLAEFNTVVTAIDRIETAVEAMAADGLIAGTNSGLLGSRNDIVGAFDLFFVTLDASAVDMPTGTGDAGLWFHVGANTDQGVRLTIEAVNVDALNNIGLGDLNADSHAFIDLRNLDLNDEVGVMRADGEDIQRFIQSIDLALAHVSSQRAHLGAMQNRLEFTIENLDVASENLSAANSRIRDADMAREMMAFTQANVLQQAAISMLAQANQAPQNILQLLR